MNHGVEVSRLDAMVHGAEVLGAPNVDSDVALKKKLGATDPGAEVLGQNSAPARGRVLHAPPARDAPCCAPAAAAARLPPSRPLRTPLPRPLRLLPPALPTAGRGPCSRPRHRRCPGRAPAGAPAAARGCARLVPWAALVR